MHSLFLFLIPAICALAGALAMYLHSRARLKQMCGILQSQATRHRLATLELTQKLNADHERRVRALQTEYARKAHMYGKQQYAIGMTAGRVSPAGFDANLN